MAYLLVSAHYMYPIFWSLWRLKQVQSTRRNHVKLKIVWSMNWAFMYVFWNDIHDDKFNAYLKRWHDFLHCTPMLVTWRKIVPWQCRKILSRSLRIKTRLCLILIIQLICDIESTIFQSLIIYIEIIISSKKYFPKVRLNKQYLCILKNKVYTIVPMFLSVMPWEHSSSIEDIGALQISHRWFSFDILLLFDCITSGLLFFWPLKSFFSF